MYFRNKTATKKTNFIFYHISVPQSRYQRVHNNLQTNQILVSQKKGFKVRDKLISQNRDE